jgi:hypothetical protein
MRRVYTVWLLRKLSSPVAMKTLMLLAVLKESLSVVSLPHIVANSPSLLDPMANYRFFSNAFFTTEIGVRLLLLAFLAISFWLIRDLIQKSPIRQYQSSF